MRIKVPQRPETALALLLGVAAVAVVILQVAVAGRRLSALEITLFGVLQFVFSTGFAFVLARMTARREFQDSQKQFAIAAYRRIKEIEKAVDRLLRRIRHTRASGKSAAELEVAFEIARGVRETITYAIADWGDVIGEEIEAVEQIEGLKMDETPRYEFELGHDDSHRGVRALAALDSESVREMFKALPSSLRIMAAEDARDSARDSYWNAIRAEIKARGGVQVGCFFDDDKMDRHSLEQLKVGDTVMIKYGDLGRRVGNLLVYDSSGQPIGVLLNNFPGDVEYDEFATQFSQAMGGTTLHGTVVEIGETATEGGHPCHFRTQVLPAANYWQEETNTQEAAHSVES